MFTQQASPLYKAFGVEPAEIMKVTSLVDGNNLPSALSSSERRESGAEVRGPLDSRRSTVFILYFL